MPPEAENYNGPQPTPVAPVAPAVTRAQQIKAEQDAKLAELEAKLAALEPDDRKHFFYHKNDVATVELVNLLSSRVDALQKDPGKRKAFFMAHPELEVRYSFKNFV